MIDPIDQLTNRQEADIADAIDAAIDDVIAAFDAVAITAILDNADDDGPSDHERDQLALMLGTDGAEYQPLTDALDASTMTSGLASFFGAIVALAAAQVHHIANTNAGVVVLARDNAVRSLHAAFVTESTIAIRQTTERMLNAIGPANTRAAQISRVIGLSSLQARSLDAMRQQLHTAIATGNKADPETMLSFARGHLSGAQQRMLAKALRDGVTTASAEAMLDRHAKALRNARVKAFAGKGAWRADAARGKASQTRESARAWFRNGGEDFATVCTLAGYSPRQVRDEVLAYLDRLDADPNHAIDMRRSRRKASIAH